MLRERDVHDALEHARHARRRDRTIAEIDAKSDISSRPDHEQHRRAIGAIHGATSEE
ncbi:MAG TPA: hypothetical protein VI197_18190 [Polyangiaceae bacterium]